MPQLRIGLGEALLELDEAEGERLIREGLASSLLGVQEDRGALVRGHLLLSALALRRGQGAVARAELRVLREAQPGFDPAQPGMLGALVSCADGAALARCGEVDEGVQLVRAGVRALRAAPWTAHVFTEHSTLMLLPFVVAVLLARAERDGDRSLAERTCLLHGAHGGRQNVRGSFLDRIERERQQRALTGLLGEAGFEQSVQQGRALDWEAVTALLDALVDEA